MHLTNLRRGLAAVLGALAIAALAVPATAFPPVTDDGNNLNGDIGRQIDTLNDGRSYGESEPPENCDWEDAKGKTRHDGVLRWRLALVDQSDWGDVYGDDPDKGTYYRYECWHEKMGCDEPEWDGDDGCYGELVFENGCGETVCYFDEIHPEKLSLYAVDGFVKNLPPPDPKFSPAGGTTFVNFDTWMWMENPPSDGHIGPITITVPGITVVTEAKLDTVKWKMGNGDTETCPLTTSEANARTECNYEYPRSSASQPGAAYQGEASTVWKAHWVAQEFGIEGDVDAPRSTDFSLQVAEVQGVVTR